MRLKRVNVDKKARRNMTFIMYCDPNGILAAIFSSMPLALKQHCIRVGAVSGIVAEHAPEQAVPAGMSRSDYANAVRYGGFYHDLGAYLQFNRWTQYPQAGRAILEREISERAVSGDARRVILETVGCCGERYDGGGFPAGLAGGEIPFHGGICAAADAADMVITGGRRGFAAASAAEYIRGNSGRIFLPEVADAFEQAGEIIAPLYRAWELSPPIWRYNDLKPVSRAYDKVIG